MHFQNCSLIKYIFKTFPQKIVPSKKKKKSKLFLKTFFEEIALSRIVFSKMLPLKKFIFKIAFLK